MLRPATSARDAVAAISGVDQRLRECCSGYRRVDVEWAAGQGKQHLAYLPDSGIIIPDMGMKKTQRREPASPSFARVLFTPVQQKVLGLLFGQSDRRFQGSEVIRLAGAGTGATHRFLKRLSESGLVTEERLGRQTYYQANPVSPVFEELTGLVRKTVGLVEPLRETLKPLAGRIRAAFIYGSVANGTDKAHSDIDLFVIADDLDYPTLFTAVRKAEEMLGRSVNPILKASREWKDEAAKADSFVTRLNAKPRLFVLGSDNGLR